MDKGESDTDLRVRDYARFAGMVALAHVVTYLAAGMLAWFFIYQAHAEAVGLGTTIRDPNDPEEWQHVET